MALTAAPNAVKRSRRPRVDSMAEAPAKKR
jgi:hypothetical protein